MVNLSRLSSWHDKNYKKLLLLPALLLVLAIIYMITFSAANDGFIRKDITLTGGTSVTVAADIAPSQVTADLSEKLPDISVRSVSDILTGEQKELIIETTADAEVARDVLEEYLGYTLTDENSSIEFTGASLSESFYKQLIIAVLVAFVFMAIVVFIIFRTPVPSLAVIISAFADIFMALALFNLLGLKMSTAGIVAFLMLIGYSVDTDILLTTRVLKRSEGSLNRRIFKAFKTGSMMTLTSIVAVFFALLIVKAFSIVLTQIFTVLLIGLIFDLLNTWVTNVSILKWYVKAKK